jgi:hypothetical protein
VGVGLVAVKEYQHHYYMVLAVTLEKQHLRKRLEHAVYTSNCSCGAIREEWKRELRQRTNLVVEDSIFLCITRIAFCCKQKPKYTPPPSEYSPMSGQLTVASTREMINALKK